MTASIDRTWSEVTTFTAVWPLAMPDRSTVVAACREVAGTAPHHVIACAGADVDALMAEAFDRAGGMDVGAFVVFHSPHGLVVAHPHERGDVAFSVELRDRLMSAMGLGAPPAVRLDRPMTLRRCGAALLVHWARDPRRPLRARRFLQVRRGSARRPAGADRPTTVDVVEPCTAFVVVPAAEIAELRATLTALGTGTSVSMGLLYAIWSAHSGGNAPGRLQVMVGLRRYSRLLGKVRGNMVGRLVLPVTAGTVAGLAEFGEAARSWIDSAEPLFLHAAKVSAVRLRSAAAAVRGRTGGGWESSWREGGVDVVWSDCGRSFGDSSAATVAWSPDHPAARRRVLFVVRPVGPALAVNVTWVDGAAHLALTYDANKVDPAPVLAVLGDSPARYLRSMAANHAEPTGSGRSA